MHQKMNPLMVSGSSRLCVRRPGASIRNVKLKTVSRVRVPTDFDEVALGSSTSLEDNDAEIPTSTQRFELLDQTEYGEHGAAFLSGNYFPVADEVTATYEENGSVDDHGHVMKMGLSGYIPSDFPLGQFAYIGPNPKFPVEHYKRWGQGPDQHDLGLGNGWHHWFEGDGMIYAVDFCAEKKIRYRNRFIRTSSWNLEVAHGGRIFRPLMNADAGTFLANALLNLILGGAFMKDSANTALVHFAGRTFALQDTCPPWELEPETLRTMSPCRFDGTLPSYVPFTAHPKILPSTGELIFFGFNPVSPPHCSVGTLSPEGKVTSLKSLWSIPFVGSIFMHDFCVTENFTILFEGSMDIKPIRQVLGQHPLQYNESKRARFGVMNRSAQATNITWFACTSPQMVYHFVNSWEDENEQGEKLIVIIGVREDGFFQEAMRANGSSGWIQDAVRRGDKIPRVHEWRINLVTGDVAETYLFETPLETPRINDKFVGRRNRYAYAGRILLSELATSTQLKFDAIVKIDLEERKTFIYEHGPNRYGMEAQFVPRPGSVDEDDGWLVMYVHDENNMSNEFHGRTECIIIDAQNIENGPITVIHLPERVPYGAHCMWRNDLRNPSDSFQGAARSKETIMRDYQRNEPRLFAFESSQIDDLMQAIGYGVSRLALGLFVHGWFPSLTFEDSSEYAFIRGAGLRLYEANRLGTFRLQESARELATGEVDSPRLILHDVENDDSCRLVREVLCILDLSYLCKPESVRLNSRSDKSKDVFPVLNDLHNGITTVGAYDIICYLYKHFLDGQHPSTLVNLYKNSTKQSPADCDRMEFDATLDLVRKPLIFWSYEASPFCAYVRKSLYRLGIPHVVLPCARGSPRRNLLYRRHNKFQVPLLEDPNRDISLFESADIVRYLDAECFHD